MKAVYIYILSLFPVWGLIGQEAAGENADFQHIYKTLEVDSVVVTASRFDVEEFIRMVEKDETFYKAFANLRTVGYKAENEIYCYGHKRKIIASYQSQTVQEIDETNCRTMQTLNPRTTGNYYKGRERKQRKKEPRYYTSKMYEKLFFTDGKICQDPKSAAKSRKNMSAMDKNIEELKKLIFKPGSKADVPMIGGRTAVFSKRMSKFYDYKIQQKTYNGKECHVFIIEAKPKYKNRRENITIINYLETYFEKITHQVVARSYEIEYQGIVTAKVKMDIAVSQLSNGDYVPTEIKYTGRWHIPTQKVENCSFVMKLSDFQTQENPITTTNP